MTESPSTGQAVPEIAYRRSLRASRRRREATTRSRRRAARGHRLAISVTAIMAFGGGAALAAAPAGTAGASADRGMLQTGSHGASVRALQRALGVSADGAFGPATRRAVRRYQRRHGLVVDGIAGPLTLSVLGVTAQAASSAPAANGPASSGLDARLVRIARCESGGNPRAVSPGGRYRGKYQFDRGTWASVGGRGDPAAAPEREQDRRAARLLARRGTAPWGACAGSG